MLKMFIRKVREENAQRSDFFKTRCLQWRCVCEDFSSISRLTEKVPQNCFNEAKLLEAA